MMGIAILLTTCLIAPMVADAGNTSGKRPNAGIEIEKYTNGILVEQSPGPLIPEGSTVIWTYKVINTGDVTLTDIRVTDDREGDIECPASCLTPGASFNCSRSGIAQLGRYKNSGTVVATVSREPQNFIILSLAEVATRTITDSATSYYLGRIPGTAVVRGTAFTDTNGNGILDDGEMGIPGIDVVYRNTRGSAVQTSDAVGRFVFVNLAPDETFEISASHPSGCCRATPGSIFNTTSVTEQVIDFGYAVSGSDCTMVFGTVFEDADRNGTHDLGEKGLPGVTVNLTNSSEVGSTLTDGYGRYMLRICASGAYTVRETNPPGYVSTTPDIVRIDLVGGSSDPNPVDFGDMEQEEVPPTSKLAQKPRQGPFFGSRTFGPGGQGCDYIENGTLYPSTEGIVPRQVTICSVDGIGKLVVGKGTLALTVGADPPQHAGIKLLQALPEDSSPGFTATGYAYDLAPLDATFQPPILLLMEFSGDEWALIESKSLVLRQWHGSEGVWRDVPLEVDAGERVISAELRQLGVVGLFEQAPLAPVMGGPAEPAPAGTPGPIFDGFPYLMAFLLALLALLLAVGWSRRPKGRDLPAMLERPLSGGTYAAKPVIVAGMESAYSAIIGVINDVDAQVKELEVMVKGFARHGFTPQDATAVADRFFYTAQVAEERMKDPRIRQYLTAEQLEQLNAQLKEAVARMILLSQSSESLRHAVDEKVSEAGQ